MWSGWNQLLTFLCACFSYLLSFKNTCLFQPFSEPKLWQNRAHPVSPSSNPSTTLTGSLSPWQTHIIIVSRRGNELLFFILSYLRHLSFESCPLIQGDSLGKGVRCSLGSLFWLINILSEECGLFFIQVSFSSSSASLSCSVNNVSRLVLHNIAVLGSTTIRLPQLSLHFIWQRRLSVLSSFPLSILIWEAFICIDFNISCYFY